MTNDIPREDTGVLAESRNDSEVCPLHHTFGRVYRFSAPTTFDHSAKAVFVGLFVYKVQLFHYVRRVCIV